MFNDLITCLFDEVSRLVSSYAEVYIYESSQYNITTLKHYEHKVIITL